MKRIFIGITATMSLMVVMASGSTTASKSGSSGGGSSSGGNTSHPPEADVEIAKCAADDLGDLAMSLKITNHSSKASDYMINVAWESANGSTQLDTSFAAANHLEAGQNTTVEAPSFKTAEGSFQCKVVSVTRFASN